MKRADTRGFARGEDAAGDNVRDVVVRLLRIARRQRRGERGRDVEHPVAGALVVARLGEVAGAEPEQIGELTHRHRAAYRANPGGGRGDHRRREAGAGDEVVVRRVERILERKLLAGRRQVDRGAGRRELCGAARAIGGADGEDVRVSGAGRSSGCRNRARSRTTRRRASRWRARAASLRRASVSCRGRRG